MLNSEMGTIRHGGRGGREDRGCGAILCHDGGVEVKVGLKKYDTTESETAPALQRKAK
jgi:hypothetical protein